MFFNKSFLKAYRKSILHPINIFVSLIKVPYILLVILFTLLFTFINNKFKIIEGNKLKNDNPPSVAKSKAKKNYETMDDVLPPP